MRQKLQDEPTTKRELFMEDVLKSAEMVIEKLTSPIHREPPGVTTKSIIQ